LLRDVGDAQAAAGVEFVHETRLLEQVQGVGTAAAQESDNAARLVATPGGEGHDVEMELAGTTLAFEAVEKDRLRAVPDR
jgi:hypothetical protein